tara:strand:+ start:2945 stop:3424 length:480 start_codon:yes stop_codon:yes gene_type:complete
MRKLDYILIFLLGFFSCALIFIVYFGFVGMTGLVISEDNLKLNLPSDWISNENILVFEDEIVLRILDATISAYEPTGSMEPVLGAGASGIRIVPKSESQVNIGDIISFRQDGELIVHRIIEKGFDEEGVYFTTKGDNSELVDGKIRFENIKYVTIGVIW